MKMRVQFAFLFLACLTSLVVEAQVTRTFDDRNTWTISEAEACKTFPPDSDDDLLPPCCGKKTDPCDCNTIYRRIDSSCNNLKNPEWGLPNSTYGRLLPPVYSDGISAPRLAVNRSPLPSPRFVRQKLFPNADLISDKFTVACMSFGQFLTHDIALLKSPDAPQKCCTSDNQLQSGTSKFCFPLKISPSDPTMGAAGIRCLNFLRTVTDRDLGCQLSKNSPARQINTVTPLIDMSHVYGNDDTFSRSLRTLSDGLLKTEVRNNRIFPPTETNKAVFCKCNMANENVCYKTGDSRANQNPELALLQILFVREHNRLAKALKAINPNFSDEKLFQEARRINIAQFQHISYYEWLPTVLGEENLIAPFGILFPTETGFVNDYNCSVTGDISSEFSMAAFRYFHTQITAILALMDDSRTVTSNITLTDWTTRPQIIELNGNADLLTIGMISQPSEQLDPNFPVAITDQLFACGKPFGIDLIATDIQRDRDHANGYYNDYRKLFDLRIATKFDDYADFIPQEKVDIIKTIYNNYQDLDLYVGGLLESDIEGAVVGPTFMNIIREQLRRTRQADRFWFESKTSGFTLEQLTEIRKTTMARIFCDNGDGVDRAQKLSFLRIDTTTNPIVNCKKIPKMDLSKWKNC